VNAIFNPFIFRGFPVSPGGGNSRKKYWYKIVICADLFALPQKALTDLRKP
jgi:hypothetical protein